MYCCLSSSFLSLFFFLLFRRPPRSTLFPTRRSSDLIAWSAGIVIAIDDGVRSTTWYVEVALAVFPASSAAETRNVYVPTRSEEHTSELQSLRHLVCRLLLEKKKKKIKKQKCSKLSIQ